MFEKVSPKHPDKIADRIAGAIVDKAYCKKENPKVAVEVLIGHNKGLIINETNTHIRKREVKKIIGRIVPELKDYEYIEVAQDKHLSDNQKESIKCGDNGIFKGVPTNLEERSLVELVKTNYQLCPTDSKFIFDKKDKKLYACVSNATKLPSGDPIGDNVDYKFNPLGYWTGGISVDSGATNRKLGSDMGRAITGGGLHGKDLSKSDVSVNIYAYLKAQELGKEVNICCAIGDEIVDGKPYSEIVEIARKYINDIGGFEKLAEWGLLR